MNRFVRRLTSVCMILVLLLAALPDAQAAGLTAYFARSGSVYVLPNTNSYSIRVGAGKKVSILGVKGDCAQIRSGSCVGYCDVGLLVLASRVRGYTNQATRIYRSASTSSDSIALGINTEVYIIGRQGGFWWVQNKSGKVTGYVPMGAVSGSKVRMRTTSSTSWKKKVVMLDWNNGATNVLPKGAYTVMYDIATGVTINVKRMGGTLHMDMEPATATDAAKLLAISGGEYSWVSRPVILKAGNTYVACAINTMPHGEQTITNNNYPGQFCLHMLNSRTHGTEKVNEEHQKAIKAAYNWAHS